MWALLLRIALATYPPLLAAGIAWGGWVTNNVMQQNAQSSLGPRFTAMDGERMEERIHATRDRQLSVIMTDIRSQIADLKTMVATLPKEVPPKWFESHVNEQFKEQNARIAKLEGK